MNAQASTAGFGFLAAATWGGSDFAGGLGARRAPALLVVLCGDLFSLFCFSAFCVARHLPVPGGRELLFAALGGFVGALALAVFYRALAMGAMGLTAALTGLITVLIPVFFSFAQQGLPPAPALIGLLAGLVAIWLITAQKSARRAPRRALGLGLLAGCGFGAQLLLFKLASAGGLVWTMTSARAAGAVAVLLAVAAAPPKRPWKGFWAAGIATGILDTAGNCFYLHAAQIGRLDVAAMVASLYPAGTIVLAALVLHERPTARQWSGMALALGAVLLLSL